MRTFDIIVILSFTIFKCSCKYNEKIIDDLKVIKNVKEAQNRFKLYKNRKLLNKIPHIYQNNSRKNNIHKPKFISPIVSIVLPVFNMEKFIETAILSLQSQTLKNFEIVLVDDSSKDKTIDVIKRIMTADKRIKLVSNQRNRGTMYSRARGVKKAQGKYITFLDPDDIIFNHKLLEKLVKNAEENSVDIVEYIILKGNEKHLKYFSRDKYTKNGTIYYQPEISKRAYEIKGKVRLNSIEIIGKLIRKDILLRTIDYIDSIGALKENLCYGEDQFMTFYLYQFARSLMIFREAGYYYYVRKGSATQLGIKIKGKKSIYSHLKIINYMYESSKDGMRKRISKYFEYLFYFLIKKRLKYANKKNRNVKLLIHNIEECNFCSDRFKAKFKEDFYFLYLE